MAKNIFSELITKIINVDHQFILTGSHCGDIVLWQLTQDGKMFDFNFIRAFSGHISAVDKLVLLPNHHFASLCSQEQTIRFWNIDSGECEKILNLTSGSVTMTQYTEIVALNNSLMVVSGSVSPAWIGFDVWDIPSGTCIFRKNGELYRPEGFSLLGRVGPDCLAMHGYYNNPLTIWKINHNECSEIACCKADASIYSMCIGPRKEIIIAGGCSINIYKLNSENKLDLIQEVLNTNYIYEIIPIGGHQLLTFDSSRNSRRIKLWDYYLSESEVILGNSLLPSGEQAIPQCFLEKTNLVLFVYDKKLHLKQLTVDITDNKNLIEIRKNARILHQSYLTQTSLFSSLPPELNVKIAAMTGKLEDNSLSEKVARDHFCKP